MPHSFANVGRAFAIADGRHVLKAVVKHWTKLAQRGASEPERKRFEATIADAEKAELSAPQGGPSLEEVRQQLKDGIGEYRAAGDLLACGFDGPHPTLVRDLKLQGHFPKTDAKLKAYIKGLAQQIKRHSAKLAERGFGKGQQDELERNAALFVRLLAERGAERGEQRAARTSRDAIFEKLRYQTGYFRRLGRAALRNSMDRADFDRVKLDKKMIALVPPPPPASPPAPEVKKAV